MNLATKITTITVVASAAFTGIAGASPAIDLTNCVTSLGMCVPIKIFQAGAATARAGGDVVKAGGNTVKAGEHVTNGVKDITGIVADGAAVAKTKADKWRRDQDAKTNARTLPVCYAKVVRRCVVPAPTSTTSPRARALPVCTVSVSMPCVVPR